MSKTKKARLDPHGTEKPKTRIVTHHPEMACIGPGSALRNPEYEDEYGNRIPLSPEPEPKLSLHKFYFDAQMRARKTGERYGQAMFNHLYEVRPDLSEQIRATDADPFYVSELSDPRWDRFISFIEKNW